MKVDLITGFLGSGKTTLVLKILQELQGQEKIAVLVNEVGRIGLDGEIISKKSMQVKEITQGCICCSLKGNFIDGVNEIYQEYAPERLLIEPTGIANPGELIKLLQYDLEDVAEISSVTGIVDAVEFFKLQTSFGNFYATQIKVPQVILINKSDLVSETELETVSWAVKEINPHAEVIPTEYCDTDIRKLLNTPWQKEKAELNNDLFPHLDIFSWKGSGTFSEKCLVTLMDDLRAGKYGHIYRAKGLFNVINKLMHIELVMGQANFEENKRSNSNSAVTVLGEIIYKDKLKNALESCLV